MPILKNVIKYYNLKDYRDNCCKVYISTITTLCQSGSNYVIMAVFLPINTMKFESNGYYYCNFF